MIESLLNNILGGRKTEEGESGKGLGSLLVIGFIAFVLLGGTKLLAPAAQDEEEPDDYYR